MSGYLFTHEGKSYSPDGLSTVEANQAEEHNRELERIELEWLKSAPERVFLYVKAASSTRERFNRRGSIGEENVSRGPYTVHTWLGTALDSNAKVGRRVFSNLDRWTYRRAITCKLFGVLYHGWYMESSGDYCRLKRAKRQS